jgi:hypothetical protein
MPKALVLEPTVMPRAEPRAPAVARFRVSLGQGMLTILNAGATAERDLRVTLRDAAGHAYRAHTEGELAPGDEVMLPLDAFDPPPPAAFRPARIAVRPGGAAADVDVTP